MAGFGGAVKLTGESEYRAALKSITGELKLLSAELKNADASFDDNGNAVDSDGKKLEVYSKILTEQKAKIQTLMGEESSLTAKIREQSAAHDQLKQKLQAEQTKLDDIGRELGEESEEYKAQAKVVDDLSAAVVKSTQNQNANEAALKKVQTELVNAKTDLQTTTAEYNKLSNATDGAGDEAVDTSKELKQLGEEAKKSGEKAEESANGGFTVLKGVLANLATDAIKGVVSGLAELAKKVIEIGQLSLENYANYEQLVGGVETLFGAGGMSLEEYAASMGKSVEKVETEYNKLITGQSTVLANAEQAYKTAGMSTNEYLETVTGFAASLVSSLKGDTEAAAQYADMAVQDMSDNANKMGTDITNIQNAYQGFAKQNYTMLDNLKLGYGGTKEEMQRLIKDANKIRKQQGINTKLTIKDFDDVVMAIHTVQEEMGITGTTAKEADQTISGSVSAVKAAWSNLLTGIADENADLEKLSGQLVDAVATAASNIVPRVVEIVKGMGAALVQVVPGLIEELKPIAEDLVSNLATAIQAKAGEIAAAGAELLSHFWDGLGEFIAGIGAKVGEIVDGIKGAFTAKIDEFKNIGKNVIDGIGSGISGAVDGVKGTVDSAANAITGFFRNPFGIHSPSTVMADEIGKPLMEGIAEGFTDAVPTEGDDMAKEGQTIIDKIAKAMVDNSDLAQQAIKAVVNALTSSITGKTAEFKAATKILMTGFKDGIDASRQAAVNAINNILTAIKNVLAANKATLASYGQQYGAALGEGVSTAATACANAVTNIVGKMVNAASGYKSSFSSAGATMGSGLAEGFKGKSGTCVDAVAKVCDAMAEKARTYKDTFKTIGKEVAESFAAGYQEGGGGDNRSVTRSLNYLSSEMQPRSISLATAAQQNRQETGMADMVDAFKKALGSVKIVLDDEVAGRFVDNTVTRLVYG